MTRWEGVFGVGLGVSAVVFLEEVGENRGVKVAILAQSHTHTHTQCRDR